MSETVHDLGALRALREVGRQGSIAAAASVLGISQQAMSARMRTLERAMSITLLARTPTGSHLTEQGRLVVGWADEVLDAADRLEAGVRSIRSGVSHRLAIAASQTIAEHLVPHWLVELRSLEQSPLEQSPLEQGPLEQAAREQATRERGALERAAPERAAPERAAPERAAPERGGLERGGSGAPGPGTADAYPPTVVELTVANSTVVVELVRNGKAGLGFIETPHLPADLVTAQLREDEMLVVAAPAHPWARRHGPLPLAEVAATPLVMREAGSGTRDTLTDHLAAQHPPLRARIAMELGTSAAVRSAIAAGVGPGVLSRLAVRDDLVLGRLVAVEVDGPPLIRRLTAVWRPDHDPLVPEAARLLSVAQRA